MYKVCILTAGLGTRNAYSTGFNKALLTLGDKPAISHIIDNFPQRIEFVIAVGHNAETVKSFVNIWHPDRNVFYKHVSKYQGKGSGPGLTLLECAPYLQCPFIFTACDTIVFGNIPKPDKNWIGTHLVSDTAPYLTVEAKDNKVVMVYDKDKDSPTKLASIGIAGVKDYEIFLKGLENPYLLNGEHQTTHGLRALIPKGITPVYFSWFDIGGTDGYENAYRFFNKTLSK